MRLRFLLAFFILTLPAQLVFADAKHITLKDGSVIKGELLSFEGGIYTVQTENLGQLQLAEANVVSVANAGMMPAMPQAAQAAQGGHGNATVSDRVSAMQTQIMSNPQTMSVIQTMAEDPEIAAMLSDPALSQALTAAMSGNSLEGVAENPNIQKLMANPKMQALIRQIQGGTQ